MGGRRRRAAGPRRGAGRGRWIAVAGTRPNYVKLAPLVAAARAAGRRLDWIDTAQHTASAMAGAIAADLRLPEPLARMPRVRAGRGRIGRMAARVETLLGGLQPALVVVLGDVDSTLAAALAAWRLDLPLVHVEAGLRSFEPAMPEERNRVLVDGLSDRLALSEPEAEEHLRAEGVARSRIRKPGNVMADALRQTRGRIAAAARAVTRGLPRGGYVVATLHRQANVDDPRRLAGYERALARIARERPVVFPVHPRTRRRLVDPTALRRAGVRLGPPRPYLDFLGLVSRAAAVVTDSGGLQVEAALLGVPCVTARAQTEHRITLRRGGNVLAGPDPRRLPGAVLRALAAGVPGGRLPRAWDGHAATRIVADWKRGFDRPGRLPAPPVAALRGL